MPDRSHGPTPAGARRFPVILSVATVLACALMIGLGVWQLQRLQWKQDLLARVAVAQTALPGPLAPVLARAARGEDVEFTRVQAACPGLSRAPWLELYSLRDGRPGTRLISICRLADGPYDAVLVDRGFLEETVSARPPVAPGGPPAIVAGVLRKGGKASPLTPALRDGRWFVRDIPAMATALGAHRPAPYVLAAETSTNPEWRALVPAPLPGRISNNHLGYAITWFGLAGALVAVYLGLLRRLRGDSSQDT